MSKTLEDDNISDESRADKIRKANKTIIKVDFPNGKEFLIYETPPLVYKKLLAKVASNVKSDVDDGVKLGVALLDEPEKTMAPILKAILHDPKLGTKADKDHITLKDVTISEFNQLVMVSRGMAPEVVASFRARTEVYTGEHSE